MADYVSTPLFGGALITDLPSNFADVSKFRQVPDHQEVFLDKDGFTSIIFDITERVGLPGSGPAIDGAALTTHLEDIVDSEVDTVQVWNTSNTEFSKLPEGTPVSTLIATQTPPPEPGSKSPVFTAIVLTMVRLEKESTDILIAINVPHIKGEYTEEEVDMQMGKQGKLIESAVEHAAKIWETFKIKDWGLFNAL
ncbi:Ran-interacting Mog1 protein [Venustampulla echinocandica]|uniref:Ran-interacting Mog1 protein n=1 Tax=Venustampulla echinocandica TaxID=2656787 RepID=A0A370T9W5_9HELO|nr:Ran-interacting Mog1 protein [Venustampulla echinocandica]RDL30449.1 Ran-interacting Mog1 protein [Venustampulla echinocandica]